MLYFLNRQSTKGYSIAYFAFVRWQIRKNGITGQISRTARWGYKKAFWFDKNLFRENKKYFHPAKRWKSNWNLQKLFDTKINLFFTARWRLLKRSISWHPDIDIEKKWLMWNKIAEK